MKKNNMYILIVLLVIVLAVLYLIVGRASGNSKRTEAGNNGTELFKMVSDYQVNSGATNKTFSFPADKNEFNIQDKVPTGGYIKIDNSGNIELKVIYYEKWCVVGYSQANEGVYVTDDLTQCLGN